MERAPNINYHWTAHLIQELIRQGCKHFVVAPGSRSTPLAAAVALNQRAKYTITFDERSAGFFALGQAKASGYPSAIIVTSGTAVANLMPAVVEASLDRVPLLVLSADRPVELRDVQANQTIYQTNFFNNYARWFFELPTPDDETPLSMLLSVAGYAVWQSRYPMAGPVHLNCLFREPLAPVTKNYDYHDEELRDPEQPFTHFEHPTKILSLSALEKLASLINTAKNGLLIVGAVKEKQAQKEILKLAEALAWPVCVDIGSGLRQNDHKLIIRHDHHAFLHPSIKNLNFDVVLQIGGRLIAKPVEQMLANRRVQTHIFVDDHPKRSDPGLTVTHRIEADIASFANSLTSRIFKTQLHPSLPLFHEVGQRNASAIADILGQKEEASEPYVARHISRVISKECMLMACTSMPIRDYHMFATYREDGGPVLVVNRGASGIDGLLSTAIGFAKASLKQSTVLIGDLAFMHDANALSLLKDLSVPMCIVLINNQGGGIFSFLPIAQFPRVFTPFIDSPHENDLSYLCKAFGVNHRQVKTKSDFNDAYATAQKDSRHIVIEVITERASNYRLHEQIKEACLVGHYEQ